MICTMWYRIDPEWSNFRGSADFTPFSFPEPLVLTFMYLDEKNDKNFFFFG